MDELRSTWPSWRLLVVMVGAVAVWAGVVQMYIGRWS